MIRISKFQRSRSHEGSEKVISNLIKDEVWAAKALSKRRLIKRVTGLLGQTQPELIVLIKNCIETLCTRKEILDAGGGLIARAPVRVYNITPHVFRTVGGPSTLVPFTSSFVHTHNAVYLKADELCAAPKTATEILQELQMRSCNSPMPFKGLQAYNHQSEQSNQFSRWETTATSTLWRMKQENYWKYFLTTGGTPVNTHFYPLQRQEAVEYMFALDRQCNNPIAIYKREYAIVIEGYLPLWAFKYTQLFLQKPQYQEGAYVYHLQELPQNLLGYRDEIIDRALKTLKAALT